MSDARPDILILLAAGSARRMQGMVEDKVCAALAGRPAFLHSLAAFAAVGTVGRVIVAHRDEPQRRRMQELLESQGQGLGVDTWVVGGGERQDSFLAALEAAGTGNPLVHIHDGARPLITPDAIRLVRARALESGAAILASRSADTVKLARPGTTTVESSPDRQLVWSAETPQVFRLELVREAYRRARQDARRVTDDSSAVSLAGHEVSLVENPDPNLKITRPSDLAVAEAILRSRAARPQPQ
ncbi:MAG: 2-C-methyl-D-erythritol 4-phosphate cytidylyltransferase [Opitutia bacterium]